MAILARVLMLVACLPLLQPTGFCVCKAGWPGRTSSAHENTSRAFTSQASVKSGCCSKRQSSDDLACASTSLPEPTPYPCPSPSDDDHLPGCPASVGVDRFKWVEPAPSFAQTLPPLDVGAFLPLVVVLPVAVHPNPPAANWPSSPPIYLSHCALVI